MKSLMARYGITQAEVAAVLGLSQPAVSSRFTGVTPMTIDEMDKIAKLLGVKPAQLLGGVPFGGSPSPNGPVTTVLRPVCGTEGEFDGYAAYVPAYALPELVAA